MCKDSALRCNLVRIIRLFGNGEHYAVADLGGGKFRKIACFPGADPGFPVEGGANPPGGAPTYDFAKFCEKLRPPISATVVFPRGLAPPPTQNSRSTSES